MELMRGCAMGLAVGYEGDGVPPLVHGGFLMTDLKVGGHFLITHISGSLILRVHLWSAPLLLALGDGFRRRGGIPGPLFGRAFIALGAHTDGG